MAAGQPTPSRALVSRLPDGTRVKLYTLSAVELMAHHRHAVVLLGALAAIRRQRRRGMMAAVSFTLGLGPLGAKRRLLASRASRLFALGLGPMAVQRRRLSGLAAVLFAFGALPSAVRVRDEDEERARTRALKKARKVAHKLRSKAKAAKTKAVNWEAMDRSLNTLWDHSKRPVFSPKDTLRLLVGGSSTAHTEEARARRIQGRRATDDDEAADGASTTITALLQRAELLPDLPSDDDEDGGGDGGGAPAARAAAGSASSRRLRRTESRAAVDAEVTDLVTHPAQKRIRALLFGDDIEAHFAATASSAKAAPKAAAGPPALLDAKTAQSVGIGLRALGVSGEGVEAEGVIRRLARAVARGDVDAAGGVGAVTTMRKLGCFTPDATQAVMADPRASVELPAPEMFVRVMTGSVPHVQRRLELLTFEEAVVDQVEAAEAAAKTLLAASEEVAGSAVLVSLLRDIVLPAGNALNRFNKNAAAAGFRLSGLSALASVKSAGGENLVQYIARRLVGYADQARRRVTAAADDGDGGAPPAGLLEDPGAGALALVYAGRDLPSAEAGSKLALQSMEADVTQARKGVAMAREGLELVAASSGKDLAASTEAVGPDHAGEAASFVAEVDGRIAALSSRVHEVDDLMRRAKAAFDKALAFFGEGESSGADEAGRVDEPSAFFGLLTGFLAQLEEAAERTEAALRKEQLQAKQAARRAARKATAADTGAGGASALVSELSGVLHSSPRRS